jgi:hypothetical protein
MDGTVGKQEKQAIRAMDVVAVTKAGRTDGRRKEQLEVSVFYTFSICSAHWLAG